MIAIVEWTPRDANCEAELANGDTGRFNLAPWVKVVPSELVWDVLPDVVKGTRCESPFLGCRLGVMSSVRNPLRVSS